MNKGSYIIDCNEGLTFQGVALKMQPTLGASANDASITTWLDTWGVQQADRFTAAMSCLWLDEWYGDTLMTAAHRTAQFDNCKLALQYATPQMALDNTRYYEPMWRAVAGSIDVLTQAFLENVNSNGADPGSDTFTLWLDYLWVQATGQKPDTTTSENARAVQKAGMGTILTTLKNSRVGLTTPQTTRIESLITLFQASEKATITPGETKVYVEGTTTTVFGRL